MNQTAFLICGYLAFFVFTGGIILLGAVVEKKVKSDKIICRKLVHIVSSLLWIICLYFFGCSVHWVILNGVGALVLGIVTVLGSMKTFYGESVNKSYGIFYFSLSTFVVALVCFLVSEELYLYTGIAYYCLALGDGFAPITAKLIKKHNPEIIPNKSLFGSLTVFIVAFVSTLLFSIIFDMQLPVLFVFSVAALTCITELYGVKGIDNLLIEFSVFGYLLLYHFGLVTLTLEIVILLSPFIAFIALSTKSLSFSGGLCGMVLFYLVAFFGEGIVPILHVSILFIVATVVSFVTSRLLRRGSQSKGKHVRTGKQLVAVGLVAVIALIVYRYTDIRFFFVIYFLTLAEQFADSMASDIGRLTKGKNIDIIRFRPIEKGISGGVSLLGTLCALIASVLLMLVPFLFGLINVEYFLLASAIAFVGTLIDSVLGSLFQALYKCGVCGAKTENSIHCQAKATLVKGVRWVDNTMVNLITSCFTCLVGCLLLLL